MPLLMIDLPTEEFMELRRLAKKAGIPLTILVNRMLNDIANKSKRDREKEAEVIRIPRSTLVLPK